MDRIGLDYECDYNRIIRMLRFHAKLFTVVGRAKRAPHWGVQSRFRVIYVGMSRMSINCVGGIT